ncbi:MAG: SPFH domain-containing protein [Paludibacter sp.]
MELIINLIIVAAVLLSGVRITQDTQRGVLFRFGRFHSVKGPGIYWLIPFFDKQKQIDIRTKTIELRQQVTITKDNINVKVKAVLWYKIVDPQNAVTKVFDYNLAVYQYSRRTVHNTMSLFNLDELVSNRVAINEQLREDIQNVAQNWGVKVELLEIKEIEILEAVEKAKALESHTHSDFLAKQEKAEVEAEAARSNYLAMELEKMSAANKSKCVSFSSEHWY